MAKKNQEIIFVFEGRRYLVKDIHFSYSQQVDSSGRPSTIPRHSNIYLVIVPMGKAKDKDILLHFATKRMFRGHIEFLRVENGLENKISSDLEFANARFERCGFSTKFEGCEGQSLMRVVIKPLIVRYQGAITELPRNPSNPFIERNTPVTEREEPNISNYHLEDTEGNRITVDEIDAKEEITVIIASTNAIGEICELDLESKKVNYEYNGQPVPNDLLTLTITANTMHIPLTTVEQEP